MYIQKKSCPRYIYKSGAHTNSCTCYIYIYMTLYIYIISPQLFAGLVQELYADDPRVWHAIFEMIVKDLAMSQQDGVDVGFGQRIYPIILGNKGDWSYLETCTVFMYIFWNLSLCSPVGFCSRGVSPQIKCI